jgi:hypothetical protein
MSYEGCLLLQDLVQSCAHGVRKKDSGGHKETYYSVKRDLLQVRKKDSGGHMRHMPLFSSTNYY